MTDEARAFWIVEPGRGEIRRDRLRSPSDDEVVVRALFSGISRGTEALVFQWPRAAERVGAHARALSGRRVSSAGQVRLCQRRPRGVRASRPDGPHRLRPASASERATSCRPQSVHVAADDVPPAAGRARRQPGDGAERHVGRPPPPRRSSRGDRRRTPSGVSSRGWRRALPAATCSSSTSIRGIVPDVAKALGVSFRTGRPTPCATPT